MFGQNLKSVASSLTVGALLAAAPISSTVSAQDVITLEMIGAVRMAKPEEVQRTQTEQGSSLAQRQDPQKSQGARATAAR